MKKGYKNMTECENCRNRWVMPDSVMAILTLIIIATTVGLIGNMIQHRETKKEAIQRGFAEYNATNGIWQWKTNHVTIER